MVTLIDFLLWIMLGSSCTSNG